MPKPTTNHQIQRHEGQPHKIPGVEEPCQWLWSWISRSGNQAITDLVIHQWVVVHDAWTVETTTEEIAAGVIKGVNEAVLFNEVVVAVADVKGEDRSEIPKRVVTVEEDDQS